MSRYPSGDPPSFTGKAVATMVLYWLFYVPGLIANIVFYNEAKAASTRWGRDLPGIGCLATMLILQAVAVLAILGMGTKPMTLASVI